AGPHELEQVDLLGVQRIDAGAPQPARHLRAIDPEEVGERRARLEITPEGRDLGSRCDRHGGQYSATNFVAQCENLEWDPGRWPSATRTWSTDWNARARSSRHVAIERGRPTISGRASSGIGRATARALARRGAPMALVCATAGGAKSRSSELGSARAGRRGRGASEARRARSARALDGPPRYEGGRARERSSRPTGSGG